MVKKTAKKKGGKKKGGGKRKKKGNLNDMTWKEALLAYDINMKEKAFEDVKYELKLLEENNLRFKSRNKKLKDEQANVISGLLKASRDFDKAIREQRVFTRDDVTMQMKSNWDQKKEQERTLIEMEEELARKKVEIETQKNQVIYWETYRDRGQQDHATTVQLLEQEIADMESSFAEIYEHLEQTLCRTKEEIEKNTAQTIDQQKIMATEKALAKMDKFSRREAIDNDWLRREAVTHRTETAELFSVVETLEEENLRLLSELFQCQVEDLHISRNFFMTQFAENDNLATNTLLEIDLDDLAHTNPDEFARGGKGSEKRAARPKSAIQKAIEDKLSRLQVENGNPEDGNEDIIEDEDDVHYDESRDAEGNEAWDPFLEFHHFDDDDFEDFLKLGPLELKLLNVNGQRMPVHRPSTPPDEIIQAREFRPDKWPVTHKMLRQTLKQSPRAAHDAAASATNDASKSDEQLTAQAT